MEVDEITIVAIDPGASGSMAVLRNGEAVTHKKFGDLTERDIWLALAEQSEPCRVIIEQVGPNRIAAHGERKQGASSMFAFGKSYGFLRGIVIASGFPFCEVRPQQWQPDMGIRSIPEEKPTDKKNRHKAKAQQLFPAVKVTHANADALLLAGYARRNLESLF
jgi:hypothetical protein